jgi:hypothetical protein
MLRWGAGGDFRGVAFAELVDQELVRLAAAVVLERVRVEETEAEPDERSPARHRRERIRSSQAVTAGAMRARWKARWSSLMSSMLR